MRRREWREAISNEETVRKAQGEGMGRRLQGRDREEKTTGKKMGRTRCEEAGESPSCRRPENWHGRRAGRAEKTERKGGAEWR